MIHLKVNGLFLSNQVKRYLQVKLNRPLPTRINPGSTRKSSTPVHYQISRENIRIHFIDSMPGYQHLLDCLFNTNQSDEQLMIGFDCES
jgi:hypothetical protein